MESDNLPLYNIEMNNKLLFTWTLSYSVINL